MKKFRISPRKLSRKKTAQNSAKFAFCEKTRKISQNSAKRKIFAERNTAQNAKILEFAAQNSAKSADFGRAKTAQKQSTKRRNAHPWVRQALRRASFLAPRMSGTGM
jgi:hypothetical protein